MTKKTLMTGQMGLAAAMAAGLEVEPVNLTDDDSTPLELQPVTLLDPDDEDTWPELNDNRGVPVDPVRTSDLPKAHAEHIVAAGAKRERKRAYNRRVNPSKDKR